MITKASEGVGAALMAVAAFNNALDLAVLKLGSSELPALQLTLFRILCQLFLIVIPIMFFNRISVLPHEHKQIWPYVVGRAVSGCMCMLLSVGAAVILPLGDAQVLQDLYPVATALVARKWLKEDLLRSTPFVLFLSVLGTILITQPTRMPQLTAMPVMPVGPLDPSPSVVSAGVGADCQRFAGVLGALLSAVLFPQPTAMPQPTTTPVEQLASSPSIVITGEDAHCQRFAGVCLRSIGQAMGIGVSLTMALNFVFARKAKEANPLQIIFWLNICQASACLAAIFFLGQEFVVPSYHGWTLLITITLFNLSYLVVSTIGSQRSPAALGAMLQSTDIVWAYFFQVALFGQHPSLPTLLGVACVVLATSLLTIEKWVLTQRHSMLK